MHILVQWCVLLYNPVIVKSSDCDCLFFAKMSRVERIIEPREIDSKNRILTVTGVSGSGKDYLVSEAEKMAPDIFDGGVMIFNLGSELSRLTFTNTDSGVPVSQDSLNKLPNEEVNPHLTKAIQSLLDQQPAVYLTHVVCRQQNDLVMSPMCERKVNAKQYVFICADPEHIYGWRKAQQSQRERDLQTADDIALHQRIAQMATVEIAATLGSGCLLIHNRPGYDAEAIEVIVEEARKLIL